MNNKRDSLKNLAKIGAIAVALPTAWTKPIVNSVFLPVHAMTSNCSSSDIVGEWTFAFGNPPDLLSPIIFFADGTGRTLGESPVTWSLNMDRLIVEIPRLFSVYDGTINADCSIITGVDTSNNDPFTATRSI